ncbi:substrate binding domain-containing protein [Methylobacterium sp. E-045]|uniref:substrate binding domain-containing protein n=1 Tax=Methylobacterium sp. E-045 TaxID=2836575 RepID=UPI0028BE6058|nr:substrate binding domain-containing protein [Methylobacterium sp. E-045]
MISRHLAPHRVCAFAAPTYLARHGIPRHPDELVGHTCVNFRFQSSGQVLRWPFRIGDRVVDIVPNAWIVTDVSDAVAAILVTGAGIGVSPTYLAATHVERGDLIPVLHDYAVDRHAITALWPESRRGNPNVRAFLTFLGEIFQTPAPWDVTVANRGAGISSGILGASAEPHGGEGPPPPVDQFGVEGPVNPLP